jgi:bacteriocin biosynthesis cyclodehydratase domain-containing protein
MGIRIDPALEYVWRDPHTVQLGVDPVRAVVPVPAVADERFLSTLRAETPRDALAAIAEQSGCSPGRAAAILGAASPAMIDVLEPTPFRVEVSGSGGLADLVAEHLAGEGLEPIRTVSPRGGPIVRVAPDARLAVVVTDHVVDPVLRGAWTRRAVPHLAVVVGDGRVRIGPLIEPDLGPCLQCVELARVDDDPHWPTLASQVWGRQAPPLTPTRAATVAATVTAIVLRRAPFTSAEPDGVLTLLDRADMSVTTRTVPRHPACACRALPGTDSDAGLHRARSPAATTSP